MDHEILNLLRDSFVISANVKEKMIDSYSELKKLGDYYLTTNYDSLFDPYFKPERIMFRRSTFSNLTGNEELEKETLYHIHGFVQELDSIILTNDQYLDRYGHVGYHQFLKKIFNDYSVLFIGSGIEDSIRNILRENKKSGSKNMNFILSRYFSDEDDLYALNSSIFADCNVKVLSYCGDKQDYIELLSIIKSWNKQINGVELNIT